MVYSNDSKMKVELPHGPFEKGYQLSGIQDPIKEAALNLVDAVDRYTMGKCLRSELLIKNNELKKLISNE